MLYQELILKIAEHVHAAKRGAERLQLPKSSIDEIQRLADRMYYGSGRKKLFGEQYYTPLRDEQQNVLGYATFQRVGQPHKGRLILTTILSRHMHPKGDNIGNFFNQRVQGIIPKRVNDLKPFSGFSSIPDSTKPQKN